MCLVQTRASNQRKSVVQYDASVNLSEGQLNEPVGSGGSAKGVAAGRFRADGRGPRSGRAVARILGQLRPLRVPQVVVEVLDVLAHLVDLLAVLVEDVLAHKVGALELFARQRAQPLVLGQFLRVGRHELFHLPAIGS